ARAMGRHPGVHQLLVCVAHGPGLAEARNTALDFPRGAALLVLDADKRLSPYGLAHLLAALDGDLGASFSYGMVACADQPGAAQLRNTIPWHARDLAHAKLVDVTLIRTS